jgi:hypothetical protein
VSLALVQEARWRDAERRRSRVGGARDRGGIRRSRTLCRPKRGGCGQRRRVSARHRPGYHCAHGRVRRRRGLVGVDARERSARRTCMLKRQGGHRHWLRPTSEWRACGACTLVQMLLSRTCGGDASTEAAMRRQWTPDDGNAGGYAARGRLRDMRQLTACCGLLVVARWPPGIVAAAAKRKRAATDVCFK